MNGWVLNGSKSSMCSPVPMKMMGLLVAATLVGNSRRRRWTDSSVSSVTSHSRRCWSYALRAPPPLACPSSLVTITDATSTLSLKALAWASQAWPMDASITYTMLSGCYRNKNFSGAWTHLEQVPECTTGAENTTQAPLRSSPWSLQVLTTALDTCNISSNNESSCLCRPLVSTMMISKFSALNLSTPSAAITTGSISV